MSDNHSREVVSCSNPKCSNSLKGLDNWLHDGSVLVRNSKLDGLIFCSLCSGWIANECRFKNLPDYLQEVIEPNCTLPSIIADLLEDHGYIKLAGVFRILEVKS